MKQYTRGTLLLVLVFSAISQSGGVARDDTKLLDCPKATRLASSTISEKQVTVKFKILTGFPVDLYWLNFDGQETQHDEILPGTMAERNSFVGHAFRARQQGSGIVLAEYVATDDARQRLEIRPCVQAKQGWSTTAWKPKPIEMSLIDDQQQPCEPAGKSADWSCVRKISMDEHAQRDRTLYGFQPEDHLEKSRACANTRQVYQTTDEDYSNARHRARVERVTEGPGYLKLKMDPQLFEYVSSWARNHSHYWSGGLLDRTIQFNNREDIAGCYANTHHIGFGVLDMDAFRHIRARIVAHMQTILEWWTQRPLEHTSTYGMRLYTRDAMLVNHVDRDDTHIASAVLQILQETDEDGGWPLEVVGEDSIVREVYLQPGEMVLYEGAKLLHGRPMRFKGNVFGNIFTHFKPRKYHYSDDL